MDADEMKVDAMISLMGIERVHLGRIWAVVNASGCDYTIDITSHERLTNKDEKETFIHG